ncbi:MAG: endolytic transglycosylase MltG [Candidatus Paceibacterota bacterium]|jgi:UPF0755 protein
MSIMENESNRKRKIPPFVITISAVIVIFLFYFLFFKNKAKVIETNNPSAQGIEDPTGQTKTNPVLNVDPVPKPIPLPLGTDRFIVSLKDTNENIAYNLLTEEYINDKDAFVVLLSGKDGKSIINPGGYKISKEMTPSQLVSVLNGKQYMKWIKIPEGLRKEEIAKLLADNLNWTKKQKDKWIKTDTTIKPEYIEGVYFPETYLIPIDETPALVASRLISKFNENFAEYLPEFTAKNIKWTSALTLASIVQREAANNADTPLIAGILWNRLNKKMQLGVDATLQYMRGDKGNGWWAPISVAEKKVASPYNTYINYGLPPHPISNPGISAIEAVLNPTITDCLYYLHDKNRITHCAATYAEHQANIDKYLKNIQPVL